MDPFASVPEQAEAKRLLSGALAGGHAHAFLLHGPAGVGKTTAALAFAAALLGDRERVLRRVHPDLRVVEALGEMIRIDRIRDLHHDLHMRPFEGDRRVYLLLDAHLLNEDAADALLKDLDVGYRLRRLSFMSRVLTDLRRGQGGATVRYGTFLDSHGIERATPASEEIDRLMDACNASRSSLVRLRYELERRGYGVSPETLDAYDTYGPDGFPERSGSERWDHRRYSADRIERARVFRETVGDLAGRYGGPRAAAIFREVDRLRVAREDRRERAAMSGFGLTRLLSYQVADQLRAGKLKTVLTEFEPVALPVHLLHREGRHASPKARVTLSFDSQYDKHTLGRVRAGFGGQALDAHQRGVADGLGDGVVDAAAPGQAALGGGGGVAHGSLLRSAPIWPGRAASIMGAGLTPEFSPTYAPTATARLPPRGAEAARPARRVVEALDLDRRGLHEGRDQQLGDPHPPGHRERLGPQIDQNDPDLAAIVAIDGPRRVQHGDAVLGGKAGARPHLPLVAGRHGDLQPGRHDRPRPRLQHEIGGERRHQVHAGRALGLIARQRQIGPVRQASDGKLHVVANSAAMRPASRSAT